MAHIYSAACTKEQHYEYGQLNETLLIRQITSWGVQVESGFRGADGNIYHHLLYVMSLEPLDNLHELFPDIHTQWHHEERQDEGAPRGQFANVGMKGGKLYASARHLKTRGITFRI